MSERKKTKKTSRKGRRDRKERRRGSAVIGIERDRDRAATYSSGEKTRLFFSLFYFSFSFRIRNIVACLLERILGIEKFCNRMLLISRFFFFGNSDFEFRFLMDIFDLFVFDLKIWKIGIQIGKLMKEKIFFKLYKFYSR